MHRLLLAFLCLPLTAQSAFEDDREECTVGVASGRATADGRPLLWKNRDADAEHNEVVWFEDGRFKHLAIVNAGARDSVWGGVNETGFCIMNSLSRDLGNAGDRGIGNGTLMKRALQTCARLDDFERLLESTAERGRRTRSNFGVIDAFGGAAIFETGGKTHVRFDATDTEVAPDGFIVRANFATTADGDRGRRRYERCGELCAEALAGARLDHRFLLRTVCRDLADPSGEPYDMAQVDAIDTTDTICRRTTVAVMVFHGVLPDENPSLTTFWSILGQPIFGVAVPSWVIAEGVAPELDGEPRAPLCDAAHAIERAHYRFEGEAQRDLETAGLERIWAALYPAEDAIFARTEATLARWRSDLPRAAEVAAFHAEVAAYAMQEMEQVRVAAARRP